MSRSTAENDFHRIRAAGPQTAAAGPRPAHRWIRAATAICLAAITVLALGADAADARVKSKGKGHRVFHGANYHPPYAALVVDDKSGEVLHAVNAEEPRHPASLTKIMTLYLLFEQLEAGKLKLDSQLPISAHAASQPPTKLGLRVDKTLAVEDAIKGLVTKSANDAAAVVAEAIGGTEEEFARLMTRKARALGMSGTTYVNASGLPAEEQITTARDQVTLGRAIQMRFPSYYGYFSTPSFTYRRISMNNHNSLLRTVEGVDGIKTGYTEASGYNLVASVRRNNRHLVCVVLGGTSNGMRDARMRQLIEAHLMLASTQRTAPMIVEKEPEPDAAAFSLSSSRSVTVSPEPAVVREVVPSGDAEEAPAAVAPPVAAPKVEPEPPSNFGTAGVP